MLSARLKRNSEIAVMVTGVLDFTLCQCQHNVSLRYWLHVLSCWHQDGAKIKAP